MNHSKRGNTKARRDEENQADGMRHPSLTDEEEAIGRAVVDSAFAVHVELGPGLLEKIYEACMEHN
jgi:hypothetical protein